MLLHRLRLQNFRQHRDTDLELGPGLTGNIGPNGAGKTTLFEAVTWALYGQKAARETADTLRWRRAAPRAEVRVELECALGPQELRLVRTLHHAELFLDGQAAPIVASKTAVAERVERLVAMSYEEFRNTYFTGQRDLAVMQDVGPAERRRFLNRLLGYDRLERAVRRVRELKGGLGREMDGLRQGMADPGALAAERAARAAEDAEAARSLAAAEEALVAVRAASDQHLPVFRGLKDFRERHQRLTADRRELEGVMREAVDLGRHLAERHEAAARAALELAALGPRLEEHGRARAALAVLDDLARDAEARSRIETTLAEIARQRAAVASRLDAARAAAAAAREAAERLEGARSERERVEAEYQEHQAAWEREKADAAAERRNLLERFDDLRRQRERVEGAGEGGACPTCGRPLGGEYHAVLELLDTQLDGVKQNGQFFRQRLEQLKAAPGPLVDLDARRHALAQAVEAGAQELAVARRAADEAVALEQEQTRADTRRAALLAEQAALKPGYDRERHDAARRLLAELEPAAERAHRLAADAERVAGLRAEREAAERRRAELVGRYAVVQRDLDALAFSESSYLAAEREMERLERSWQEADGAVVQARAEQRLARERLRDAERREQESAARAARLSELRAEVRLHEALDASLGELSADLNTEIGPEMAAIAGEFLATLTDGQFDEIQLDDAFEATVLADGEARPVLSGGEQDLRDLVLRLAVSQMIAERAGQPFSLLVLDEIFGSLDDLHRTNVVNLLRALEARFPQVFLITHVEGVRESLDRVLRVRFDEESGAAVVTDERGVEPPPGVHDAHVAA